MRDKISRRAFGKRLAGIAAGGVVGGAIGGGLGYVGASRVADGAREALDELVGLSVDMYTELTAMPERRLAYQVGELREQMGLLEAGLETSSELWSSVGFIEPERYEALVESLDKAEKYVEDADLKERLIRLRDRTVNRLVQADKGSFDRLPGFARDAAEWFTRLVKPEDAQDREAYDAFASRLSGLVDVYDTQQDNINAQTGVLDRTNDYFAEARGEVLERVDAILGSDLSQDERKYFEGFREFVAGDESGRGTADYLLNAESIHITLGRISELEELGEELDDTITDLQNLQEAMDEAVDLRDELRGAREKDLPALQERAGEMLSGMEETQRYLEDKGYTLPDDEAAFNALTQPAKILLSELPRYGMYLGGVAGTALGVVATYKFGPKKKGIENKALRRELGEKGERVDQLERQLADAGEMHVTERDKRRQLQQEAEELQPGGDLREAGEQRRMQEDIYNGTNGDN